MLGEFEILPRGPFSLAASARFLEGFGRAMHAERTPAHHLHLAFVPDGEAEEAVGVSVREEDGMVRGRTFSSEDASAPPEPEAVRRQVERILSLDVDGSGFAEVGRRDPVVGELQARYPGLRPVNFFSPYEAAAWALIGHRISMGQAARVKGRIAQELGRGVEIEGEVVHAFPGPGRLRSLESFPGLFGRKVEYLQSLANATLDGRLEPVRLRSLPEQDALAELKQLHGVGDFSAQLILLRGAGAPDALGTAEPRLRRAVAIAYSLPAEPGAEELVEIADGWRPYRTWVSVLLRTMLEDDKGTLPDQGRVSRHQGAHTTRKGGCPAAPTSPYSPPGPAQRCRVEAIRKLQ